MPGLTARERESLAYAAVVLRDWAGRRDDAADPETRSLRYAAGQLDHFLTEPEEEGAGMPRGRNEAGIALRNNGNQGFASVSEGPDGNVEVEVGIQGGHAGRVTVVLNDEVVLGAPAGEMEREDA